jgi:hypothetical protein
MKLSRGLVYAVYIIIAIIIIVTMVLAFMPNQR